MNRFLPKSISQERYLQLVGLVTLARDYVKKENDLRDAAVKILGDEYADHINDVFWGSRELDEMLKILNVKTAKSKKRK